MAKILGLDLGTNSIGWAITEQQDDNYTLVDKPEGNIVHNTFLNGVIHLSPEKTIFVSDSAAREQLVEQGLAYSIGPGFPNKKAFLRQIPLGDLHQVITAVHNPAIPMLPETKRYLELLKEELENDS